MSKRFSLFTAVAAGCLAAAAAVAATGGAHVDQVGQKFSQSSVSLKAGDHIIFENHDDVQHDVKVVDADGNESDKGLQTPGEVIDVAFDEAGQFTMRCAIHPRMRMSVNVQ